MIFGNRSLAVHLARGLAGLGLLAGGVGLSVARDEIWPGLIALPFAVLLLKGCPGCWMIGLGETLATRFSRPSGPPAPPDRAR